MISERKKAVLILSATLMMGILIGLLIPGLFHKFYRSDQNGRWNRNHSADQKKEWFTRTIYKIVKPDSAQSKQIKPITEWASQRIETVENSSNTQLSLIMDSVKLQLKPILTDEQLQRLNEFDTKAKWRWRGRNNKGK